VHAMPSDHIDDPEAEYGWPSFRDGRLSQNSEPYVSPRRGESWNWGQKLGLVGLVSLVPLLGIWTLAGAATILVRRQPGGFNARRGRRAPGASPPAVP
jgi:hypothetical protein